MTSPLDQLHDFYVPPLPSWTPQTTGWYVLFALVGLLAGWFAIRAIRHRIANRYRREALRELPATPPEQISSLLKRVALVAWPRSQVASLNGDAWLSFLCNSENDDEFHNLPGSRLEEIALHPTDVSAEDTQALRRIAANWIRRHRVQA